ncbi:MAG: ABC transporter ATP-binding protein, partial [Phycisphaerales bacterium]|nr:ABC transporter ATP-binding protein [Phycisphaerales bacterium]
VILRAQGLRKSFRMGDTRIEVLKSVDLTVRQGEFIAIEGRSGSGKSTLLHLLGALDEADGGGIEFDGRDIATLGSTARSHLRNTQFGFVFQFYYLLPELNVQENTLLGPMIEYSWLSFRRHRSELRKRAVGVLTQLGLEHRLRHKPSQLSGGERQRVAIARALMNSPRVLFADEPTGNLDAETGRQIMSVLERLHRESAQTIIMVTHDRSLARQADRTLVLKDGKLDRPADGAVPASAASR